MSVAHTSLTLEDFLALPEEEPALELDCGRVVQKLAPQGYHSVIQAFLVERINRVSCPASEASHFRNCEPRLGNAPMSLISRCIAGIAYPRDVDGRVVPAIPNGFRLNY